MYKCNDCEVIFDDPYCNADEELCCPECHSLDYSEYDEGYEAYNNTQR